MGNPWKLLCFPSNSAALNKGVSHNNPNASYDLKCPKRKMVAVLDQHTLLQEHRRGPSRGISHLPRSYLFVAFSIGFHHATRPYSKHHDVPRKPETWHYLQCVRGFARGFLRYENQRKISDHDLGESPYKRPSLTIAVAMSRTTDYSSKTYSPFAILNLGSIPCKPRFSPPQYFALIKCRGGHVLVSANSGKWIFP